MDFDKPWRPSVDEDGTVLHTPILDLRLVSATGEHSVEVFVVDSGADISLGPRRLCQFLGIRWADGVPVTLTGISRRKTCRMKGRIHPVQMIVPEVQKCITIPMCLAWTEAPLLLDRTGFFDHFEVSFNKLRRLTRFTLI